MAHETPGRDADKQRWDMLLKSGVQSPAEDACQQQGVSNVCINPCGSLMPLLLPWLLALPELCLITTMYGSSPPVAQKSRSGLGNHVSLISLA